MGFEAENECHAQAVTKAEVKMQHVLRNAPMMTERAAAEQQRPFNRDEEKRDNSLWSSGVKYIRSSPRLRIKSLLSNIVPGGGFLPGGSRGRAATRMSRTAPAVSPFFRRVIIP